MRYSRSQKIETKIQKLIYKNIDQDLIINHKQLKFVLNQTTTGTKCDDNVMDIDKISLFLTVFNANFKYLYLNKEILKSRIFV